MITSWLCMLMIWRTTSRTHMLASCLTSLVVQTFTLVSRRSAHPVLHLQMLLPFGTC